MNKMTVDEMLEEVLRIERESIKKRKNAIGTDLARPGRYKEDADVVKEILKLIEDRGIGNED